MLQDPEFSALLDQAARNLDSLELLARSAGQDARAVERLRERLGALQRAYRLETNAITQQVLRRAVERRVKDRRGGVRDGGETRRIEPILS